MSRAQAINRAIAFARNAGWRLCLLSVLLSVAVGGPAACVIHCLRHHAAPAVQALASHHDMHHTEHSRMGHTERSIPDDPRYPTTSDEPTALTIGVVLPLLLLPLLQARALTRSPGLPPLRDVWLLPPRDPPRRLLAQN